MFRSKRARLLVLMSLLLVCRGRIANGQTLTTLWQFGSLSNDADGGAPSAGLVQSNDGNFYGTTYFGGSGGSGTVFQISSTGTFTNLHSFSGGDGAGPAAVLVQGGDGNFYGTTRQGGTSGFGTVFRISPSGNFTNLHSFNSADGAGPAALIQGNDGNFYGTTEFGGNTNESVEIGQGYGTVFRISPCGGFTNLYSFSFTDGSEPQAGLTQGNDSNFYGTTSAGGTNFGGTVFRIDPNGNFTNLYYFSGVNLFYFNGNDGSDPEAALVQGSDGNFYGTTLNGGSSTSCMFGCGTVFRISPRGSFSNLYSFTRTLSDEAFAQAGLVQGSDGNFYGTTFWGGTNGNWGTAFQISPGGTFTNLHSFSGRDGGEPAAGLVQGCDGNFYGTTAGGGGPREIGTVFVLSVPLNPPANQISGFNIAGSNIVFAIPSVYNETYQLQCSADLTSGIWSNIDGAYVSNSIGALLTFTNFGGACSPQGFYRFDITP